MPKKNSYNLRLDEDTRAKLDRLADLEHTNSANIIRTMIHNRFDMLSNLEPRCATGAPCMMAGVYLTNAKALADANLAHLPGTEAA